MRNTRQRMPLLIILAFAFIVRVWGVDFGLPYFYFHTDETLTIDKVRGDIVVDLRKGEALNIMHYFLRAVDSIVWVTDTTVSYIKDDVINKGKGRVLSVRYNFSRLMDRVNGERNTLFPYLKIIFWGRVISALLSTLNVLIVYLLGKKLFTRRIGILASLFLSVSFVDVQMAHYIRQDVYTHLLGLLAILFSVKFLLEKGTRYLSFSSFLVGVAGSIRLNGFIFIIPLLVVLLLKIRGFGLLIKNVFIMGIFFLFGHALSSLPTLLSFPISTWTNFVSGPLTVQKAATYASSAGGLPTYKFYIIYLAQVGLYYPLFLISLLGLGLFIARKHKYKIFILSFPLIYFVIISMRTTRFDRLTTAITPFFAIYSAYLISFIWEKKKVFALVIFVVVFCVSLFRVLLFDLIISGKDTREYAWEWIQEKVEKDYNLYMIGSMNQIGHVLQKTGYGNVVNVYELEKTDSWKFKEGLVFVSSADYQVFQNYKNISPYKESWQNYTQFKRGAEKVLEFSNPYFARGFFSPAYLEHSATVNAYHNPTVKVFKVKESYLER